MYRKLPTITEDAETLQRLMRREHDPKKYQRLHALYLIQTGQARSRTAIGQVLGMNRETIGDWLAAYAEGGLPQFLDIRRPPGQQPWVPPEGLAALEAKLRDPRGFGSYHEIRQWLIDEYGVTMTADAVGNLVRRKFGGRPKVARPRPKKKRARSRHSRTPSSRS